MTGAVIIKNVEPRRLPQHDNLHSESMKRRFTSPQSRLLQQTAHFFLCLSLSHA